MTHGVIAKNALACVAKKYVNRYGPSQLVSRARPTKAVTVTLKRDSKAKYPIARGLRAAPICWFPAKRDWIKLVDVPVGTKRELRLRVTFRWRDQSWQLRKHGKRRVGLEEHTGLLGCLAKRRHVGGNKAKHLWNAARIGCFTTELLCSAKHPIAQRR